MKRGLLTLAIIAIALLCNSVYAYAPLIGDIPDVYIGDQEDNVGRPPGVDINFFRFSNAFNFDKYVSKDTNDPDQSTTNVRWSFLEFPDLGSLTINGKGTIADPAAAIDPGVKELTQYPNNNPGWEPLNPGRVTSQADFRDLIDSPGSPPWGPPTTPLNTEITIYVSNGAKATSHTIIVKANIGVPDAPDFLSGGISIIPVGGWTDPASQGWNKVLGGAAGSFVGRTSDGKPFYVAAQTTSGGSIGISGSDTQFVWGYWQSPSDIIPYVANNIYRIAYTISTTQADPTKVPNCRLLTNFQGAGPSYPLYMAGGNRVGKGLAGLAPSTSGSTYNVYIGPPDLTGLATNLRVYFEVIDFDNAETGTNFLDDVSVDRFATPAKDPAKLVRTYAPPFTSPTWSPITLGSPFGNATVGSNVTGLYIQTAATPIAPVSGQIDYGSWYLLASDSLDSFAAGKLYRIVYTMQKSASGDNIGKIRLINANGGGDWSGKIALVSDATTVHMPGTGPTEYSTWLETMPALYSTPPLKNKMSYQIDVSDGKASQVGRLYVTKVELYAYDIP
jgi:hypothetical protein